MEDNKIEYRIKEDNGLFYIQIKVLVQDWFIIFKKNYYEWMYVNTNGGVYRPYITSMLFMLPTGQKMLKPFDNLKSAKDKVIEFKNRGISKSKYHYL